MNTFLNGLGTFIIVCMFLFLGFMYIRNLVRLYRAFLIEDYSLITVLRCIGVFTFLGGVVMGFV